MDFFNSEVPVRAASGGFGAGEKALAVSFLTELPYG
jgi:hypothetical protein